ncbi:MAG: hypothetical protein HWE20_07935 [Gammaproteobacteria bacterium]|nr:hypothetical protein [Gammaproteobacteria bacterium]
MKKRPHIKSYSFTCVLFSLISVLATSVALAMDLAPLEDQDFINAPPERVELGRLLFHDKILSGNRNIACNTCHHQDFGSSDGLSLSIGEGGIGIGPERQLGVGKNRVVRRVARNAPGLFNLTHKSNTVAFHDGRLVKSEDGFEHNTEGLLDSRLASLIAAQALFPMTAPDEMAGQQNENIVGLVVPSNLNEAWKVITYRIRNLDGYWPLFKAAYPELASAQDIDMPHIANALADFMDANWRVTQTPYDRFVNGDNAALDTQQQRGMELFFGRALCASCHKPPLFSDGQFHNIGLPSFGPGKLSGGGNYVDKGRALVTGSDLGNFAFKTPQLRNWAFTAPYGHNGAHATIEGMLEQHFEPKQTARAWTLDQAVLPQQSDDLTATDKTPSYQAHQQPNLAIQRIVLSDEQRDDLMAFLETLNDPATARGNLPVPDEVPSGLAVD